MNNELIERIDIELAGIQAVIDCSKAILPDGKVVELSSTADVLRDCKAALTHMAEDLETVVVKHASLSIALAQQQEAEPVAWVLTGTDRDLVPRKYLLFSGREAELHVAQNLAGGEWQSCAAKPLFLHPPKPTAQPLPMPETDGDGCVHTGNVDADRIINRLNSSDPDFEDCSDAVALIYKLVSEMKGPDGFATWKDAAIAERVKKAAQPQVPEGMIRVSIDLLDALDNKVRACNRTEHHHAKEILAEEAVEALDYLLSAAKEEGK